MCCNCSYSSGFGAHKYGRLGYFLGGKLLRTEATNPEEKVSHYYNEIVPNSLLDLTREQFPFGTEFAEPQYRERDYVLSFAPTVARYEILKNRVMTNPIIEQSDKTRLYLAHSTLDRHEVRQQELMLERELGIDLYNPFYDTDRPEIRDLDAGIRKPYSQGADPKLVVTRDLNKIDDYDGLVAIVSKESIGASSEIFYNSYVLKKPTYLIITNERLFEHPWLKYLATERFHSVEEFKEWFLNKE